MAAYIWALCSRYSDLDRSSGFWLRQETDRNDVRVRLMSGPKRCMSPIETPGDDILETARQRRNTVPGRLCP